MTDNLEGVIPPHDLRVEAALLGAMLLSARKDPAHTKAIIKTAVGGLRGNDFYLPAHGVIFDAIMSLANDDQPVDVVLVADYLRQRRKLDAIGGPALLMQLTVDTPASYHMARYAEIVTRLAMERRHVMLGADLLEAALASDTATVMRLAAAIVELGQPAPAATDEDTEATVTPLRRPS